MLAQVYPNVQLSTEKGNLMPNKIEKLHTTYIKRALSVPDQTPHLALYGETGRTPLLVRQQYLTLKYWCRIINLNDDHILKCIYNSLQSLPNQNCWLKTIKSCLQAAGLTPANLNEIQTYFYLKNVFYETIP